jgi:hypothetical protein
MDNIHWEHSEMSVIYGYLRWDNRACWRNTGIILLREKRGIQTTQVPENHS